MHCASRAWGIGLLSNVEVCEPISNGLRAAESNDNQLLRMIDAYKACAIGWTNAVTRVSNVVTRI